MIIRENGLVVGLLDDSSLKLTEVKSTRLQEFVDGLRKTGFTMLGAQEEELGEGQACGSVELTLPFTSENLGILHVELSKAGFEVQRA